jgi:hypothetical protein
LGEQSSPHFYFNGKGVVCIEFEFENLKFEVGFFIMIYDAAVMMILMAV